MDYLSTSYNGSLVALSFVIASLASYTAIDVARKVRGAQGRTKFVWLSIGAIAMGVGVWSMHFVGMLALQLPVQVSYNPLITIATSFAAILAAGIAFLTISGKKLGVFRLLFSGVIMGSGVVAMHYGGMYAMQMAAHTSYDPLLFAASVAIAVVASIAAMIIFYGLTSPWAINKGAGFLFIMRTVAALVMGVAVCGMHYTGMAAARFTPTNTMLQITGVDSWLLGFAVTVSTFVILFTALMSSIMSRNFGVSNMAGSAGD